MSRRDPRHDRSDRDVLDNLGALIGGRIKKGVSKLGKLISDPKKTKNGSGQFLGYVKVLLDDPAVASVTPSSRYLVERVVKAMRLEKAKIIVEYGAARGVMTRRILSQMRPDARLIAIEFNRELYQALVSHLRDPRLIAVRGDVREIDQILARHGVKCADVIISGVPFAFFSGRGRHELLTKTAELLCQGGRFVPYQVTTHLIPMLKEYFSRVDVQFEVRNIPPHFVFVATK